MKKTVFIAAGVVALSLMSFAANEGKGIIEFDGDVITVKDTDKISPEELEFMSVNVLGWTYCDRQSETNQCLTRNRNFPKFASSDIQEKMNYIIEKYK